MPDLDEIRARAAAHDEEIESVRWPTAAQLAAKWNVSVAMIYAIPRDRLPYKAFGTGPRPRRRYRPADVAAFEATDASYAAPATHAERSA
jgi:hypothetical protein